MAITEHGALQPHVVLVPSPSKGHTIPFMILTKQLVGNGVRVTLVSSDKHIVSLEQAKVCQEEGQAGMDKVNFVGLREGPSNFMEAISEASDVRMAEMLSEWLTMAMEMPQKLESDGHSHTRAAPCCIISDMFGGWTQDVAKKFGIPNHVLFNSPAACAAVQLTIPKLFEEGILPFPRGSHKGYVNIPGIPPLDPHDLPEYLVAEESSTKHKFYTRHTLRLSNASCILINTFSDFEKGVFDAVNNLINTSALKIKSFTPIEPLLAVNQGNLKPEDRHPAEKWLNTQKDSSVIYVAFGTEIFFPPEQVLEIAQGLEASEQPFILVLQLSEQHGDKSDFFSAGFEERIKN